MADSARDGAAGPRRDGPGPGPPPVDSSVLVDPRGTRLEHAGHPADPEAEEARRSRAEVRAKAHPIRTALLLTLVVAAVGAALYFATPRVSEAMRTVSTDDAFVASYITNVSARVDDNVVAVLVDRNDFVEEGQLLIQLDREPMEVAVAQSDAALETARAALDQTRAESKAQLAAVRAQWFATKDQREQTRRQVATLKAGVATYRRSQYDQTLAELNFHRYQNLVDKGSATRAELDQQTNQLASARATVEEARLQVAAARASLGLPAEVENPLEIPGNLEDERSTIQESLSNVATALARLGLPFEVTGADPKSTLKQVLDLNTDRGVEGAFGGLVDRTPQVRQAVARVNQAERDLDNAKLQLAYTEIRSQITGYVEDRTVNPGNRVAPGQTLLSVRPLTGVWVDANFKESQIDDIVIGHPVDLYVDAYPTRVFKGRVQGFSTATGAAASILPPENATGNYVKVVQRLPVRIFLNEEPPTDTPLMAGLSVVPVVRIREAPTGPHAGERLRGVAWNNRPGRGGGVRRPDAAAAKSTPRGDRRGGGT